MTNKSRLGTEVVVPRAMNVPGHGLVDHFQGTGRIIGEALTAKPAEYLVEFADGAHVWFTAQRLGFVAVSA